MDGHRREAKLRTRLLMHAPVMLLQLLCYAVNVTTAYDFYVWNGLPLYLRVGDQEPDVAPGNLFKYTKDAIDSAYIEYFAPTSAGLEDVNCETGVQMIRPEFQFRDGGWAVYVYTNGFFPVSDPQGTGSPVQRWPQLKDACQIEYGQ